MSDFKSKLEQFPKHGNIREVIQEHKNDIENPSPRVRTGFYELDKHLRRGIEFSDFFIIAGDTGSFKSTFATNILINTIKQGIGAAFYNYEMSSLQTLRRLLCRESNLSLDVVETKTQNPFLASKVEDAIKYLEDKHIYLIDNGVSDIDDLVKSMHKLHADGVRLFIVDYIQLVSGSGAGKSQEVENISRKLRQTALGLKSVVVGLSQTSLQHKKEGRDPELFDMKWSGGLSNDAVQCVMVTTKKYHEIVDAESAYVPLYRESNLHLKKNRNGQAPVVAKCLVIPSYYKFINLEFNNSTEPEEFGCAECGREDLIIVDNNFYCANCGVKHTPTCTCSNGLVFYEKQTDGTDYSYLGLCASCGRGAGIAAAITATNASISSSKDKITIPPFIKPENVLEEIEL